MKWCSVKWWSKTAIAIARALYRSKPILILDEHRALDRPSELKILDNILSITDLTVILVTHNHDLLTQFDQVFSITTTNYGSQHTNALS